MSENLVEKYATKTYIDKDYKDIVVNEKQFVNLVNENKKQKEVIDKIKEILLYKYPALNSDMDDLKQEILELLEEIK